ncbi:MAG: NCS2 family permease [Acidobacteriota bacterium]|jgi:AGZA family xanthine/uracil permease-like MFS transporter|nr:NCS2 family permease [Bryobacteraceae bacterium CoA2 C42]MCA2966056.1 NCS2 family permease [Acidobacteriaceae bacterium]
MLSRLAEYFDFAALGTNWRTEILAGCTTFLTMAYIIFVNPSVLAAAGMPVAAVTAATCLAAGLASILMGAVARYPLAMAPGMGLNAYFTYAVVQGMGVPWPTALGAVFLSGAAFLLLTLTGLRRRLVEAVPPSLYAAVAAGIGLFLAFIGLKNAGIIVAHPATTVALGQLTAPGPATALGGLLLTAVLLVRRVPGAMLAGLLATALLAGWSARPAPEASLTAIAATAGHLDLAGALRLGFVEIIFAFLFVDLFDNLGTLLAVSKRAGLLDAAGRIPRVDRILVTDSVATMGGALLGTSTVVSYIESAAGVAAGGRSGVAAIVAGLLFLASFFLAPWLGAVPAYATAPALILVGALLMTHASEVAWDDYPAAIPAFLTLVTIPLTFSIASGLAFGLIAHTLLSVAANRGRQISPFLYVLTAILLARFFWIPAA